MGHNLLVLALTALIPLIVGAAWYSPMLFAKAWMQATGMTEEKARNGSMAISMGLLYVFSFLIAVTLLSTVIHQFGLNSMLLTPEGTAAMKNPDSDISKALELLRGQMHNFRTYKHGALHGAIIAVFFALPLIASGAVFEKRGFKYIMITWGFWFINLTLMGAVICHWIIGPFEGGTGGM